ncbi:MAG: hypothetical protein ABI131_06420 [Nostocoides sp.]
MAGGLLLRLGSGLRTDATRTTSAYAGLQGEWVGRASVGARRRGDVLAAATSTVAAEASTVGALLQRHSTDLAGLLEEEVGIAARAGAAGLVVAESGVVLAPGVRGLADSGQIARTESERAALAAALHDLQHRLATTRAALHGALADSVGRLTSAASSLR